MRFPNTLYEDDTVEEMSIGISEAIGEMDIEVGDIYFKKGHSHLVTTVNPESGTMTIRHTDGGEKERDIIRQWRDWKSGWIVPVERDGFTADM